MDSIIANERQALITQLVTVIDNIRADLMLYDACDGRADVMREGLKVWHEPRHILKHIAKVWEVEETLQQQNLPKDEYRAKLLEVFLEAMRDWANEDPNHIITDGALYWWTFVTVSLDIGDLIWTPLLIHTIKHDYERFETNFEQMKEDCALQVNLSAVDFADLLLTPPDFNFPPGHLFWKSLGVNNVAEWNNLGVIKVFREAQRAKTGDANRTLRAVITTSLRSLLSQDAKQGSRDREAPDNKYDQTKLENLKATSVAKLKDDGYIYSGSEYGDPEGEDNQIIQIRDNTIDNMQLEKDWEENRVKLISQLKPRELDLFNAEVERLEAKKTREQWYGSTDKAQRVTQRVKYLKSKYFKH